MNVDDELLMNALANKLRKETRSGLIPCFKALRETNMDYDKAKGIITNGR